MNETKQNNTEVINVVGACAMCLNIDPLHELIKVKTTVGMFDICTDCATNNTFKCGMCGKVHYKSGIYGIKPCKGGDEYGDICPECDEKRRESLKDDQYICDYCGNIHSTTEEEGEVHYGEYGELIACPECVDSYFEVCRDCGKHYITTELTFLGYCEEYVCDECKEDYEECEHCGDLYRAEEMERDGSTYYCNDCYEDNYSYCDCCHHIVDRDDTHYHEPQDMVYCDDCWEDNTFICDDCGERHLTTERNYALDAHDDNIEVCDKCYDNYYTCADCGETYHFDNLNYCDEDGNYYCNECESKRDEIHDYYYKPEPVFHGSRVNGDSTRYFGVEIEIDGAGENTQHARRLLDCMESGYLYAKHDGSLDEGFELVSHPGTLEYHMNANYSGMFQTAVRMGYRAHQTDTCGLHVHVSRQSLGDSYEERELTVMKLLYLVEKHWDNMVKFSRRTNGQLGEWADRYLTDSYTRQNCLNSTYDGAKRLHDIAKDGSRYKAINLNNDHTIEFRIFKGTLKYNSFIATLQFVDVLCNIAKESSVQKIVATSWDDIIEECKDRKELMQYLVERKLFTFADSEGEEL